MYETQPIKTDSIWLAVDGSLSTKSAAYTAAQLASALHWSICAEYIVDVTQVFEVYGDTHQELSEFGDVVPREEQITFLATQADLILMGAYRHGQILEWAGHSVLDTVLHEINLPILAAK